MARGRKAEGWQLEHDARRGVYFVRYTVGGRREHRRLQGASESIARGEAARIYAEAVLSCGPAQPDRVPLSELTERWLDEVKSELDHLTVATYRRYLGTFAKRWRTLDEVTRGAADVYWRERLQHVTRSTVAKELAALRGLLEWALEAGFLAELPAVRNPPRRALGTRGGNNPKGAPVPLEPDQVERILAALPERTNGGGRGPGFVVRARFTFAWETALRPSTLDELESPGDWYQGRATLRIRDEVDKARFGRELPISERARAILDELAPRRGLIFGHHDHREPWRAAVAAVLPPELAAHCSPYDLRHARLTHLVELNPNLPGVAYLAGHKHLTTTSIYLRSSQRAAAEVLATAARIGENSGRGKDEEKDK